MSRLRNLNVLVVEDDYFLASEAVDWLGAEGASVIGPAPNAAAALRLAEGGRVDVAVLDLNLGHGPDDALARQLVAWAIPLLILSGYDRDAAPGELAGAAWLAKPVQRAALIAAVERATTIDTGQRTDLG